MSPAWPDVRDADREDLAGRAGQAVAAARAALVLGRDARSVFFATLALRLRTEVGWHCQTVATDGRRLVYNPMFVAQVLMQRTGLRAYPLDGSRR